MDKLYFLEFSMSQGFFHIDGAVTLCKKNLAATVRGSPNDYIPIFIGSLDECNRMADALRPKLKKYYHGTRDEISTLAKT